VEARELEWIDRFLSHLKSERRMSGHTIAAYRHDLLNLAKFCKRRGVVRWEALDNLQIRAFAAAEHAGGIAPRSIQRRLSALRSFFEYLQREGLRGTQKHRQATGDHANNSGRGRPGVTAQGEMVRCLR